MTSSMVLRRLAGHTFISDGCTEKTLEQEMNELTFRPPVQVSIVFHVANNPSKRFWSLGGSKL